MREEVATGENEYRGILTIETKTPDISFFPLLCRNTNVGSDRCGRDPRNRVNAASLSATYRPLRDGPSQGRGRRQRGRLGAGSAARQQWNLAVGPSTRQLAKGSVAPTFRPRVE